MTEITRPVRDDTPRALACQADVEREVGRMIGIVFRWILIFRYSDLGLGCF